MESNLTTTNDNKVHAINEMPAPSDKKGVERLLGTVNYLGKFVPNLATVTEPLEFSKKGQSLNLSGHMNKTKHFEGLKQSLPKTEVQF